MDSKRRSKRKLAPVMIMWLRLYFFFCRPQHYFGVTSTLIQDHFSSGTGSGVSSQVSSCLAYDLPWACVQSLSLILIPLSLDHRHEGTFIAWYFFSLTLTPSFIFRSENLFFDDTAWHIIQHACSHPVPGEERTTTMNMKIIMEKIRQTMTNKHG